MKTKLGLTTLRTQITQLKLVFKNRSSEKEVNMLPINHAKQFHKPWFGMREHFKKKNVSDKTKNTDSTHLLCHAQSSEPHLGITVQVALRAPKFL